jgi:hypothetical protein
MNAPKKKVQRLEMKVKENEEKNIIGCLLSTDTHLGIMRKTQREGRDPQRLCHVENRKRKRKSDQRRCGQKHKGHKETKR